MAADNEHQSKTPAVMTAAVVLVAFMVLLYFRAIPATDLAPLAADSANAPGAWADESRCLECHAEAESFAETGHARTLSPAASEPSMALLASLNELPAAGQEGIRVELDSGIPIAVSEVAGLQHENELDWCFGSGTHARTWVSTLADSHGVTDTLEFRYTWFADLNDFAVTPGQPSAAGRSAVSCMGLLFGGRRGRRCFSCHSSQVPVEHGKILEDQIHAGVTCQRCHGPRGDHVASEGESHPTGWQIKDRLDAVHRCAVCHRLKSEKNPEEITPDNLGIVRFQPMGLMESPCFLNSDMTCTTCHDPHRPMEQQDSRGIWQCVQCHDRNVENQTHCGLGRTDDCLRCHMPAIQMDFPVRFTDHWIRVRSDQPVSADKDAP